MTNIRTIDDVIDMIQTDAEVRRRMVSALNVPGTDTQEKVLASVDRLTQNVDNLTTTVGHQGKNIDSLTENIDNLTKTVGEQGKNIDNLTKNVENLTTTVGEQGKYIDNLTTTVGEQGKRYIDNLSISLESLRQSVTWRQEFSATIPRTEQLPRSSPIWASSSEESGAQGSCMLNMAGWALTTTTVR